MMEVRSERQTEPTDRGMSDWQKTTVGEIASGFLSGGTPSTSRADFWEGENPWITSKWLGDKLELTTGEKFVSEGAVKKTATKIVPKDSIIFATRVGVGKVGINRIDLAINQDLAGVLIDNERYDIKFLAYQLGIDSIQQYVAMNKRGATIKGITRDCLEQIRLNLPPLPEQKKIAHILSTVQRAIEAQERIIQTTTELKKALMHKLFTEGLRNEPQKQTEIGPIPESWEVVEIGDLGKCITGSTPKTKVDSFYDPPTEDFIAPADLGARRYVYDSEKKISPEGMATIRPIPRNAVMCVCIGSSIGKVGMSYREESATNQQINSIICGEGRDPEFVYCLLSYRSDYWKSFATFGPVPILSKGRFSTIGVPIPSSLDEQQAIAKPLVALETKVEVAEKKVTVLKDLFRTLLHELMTAKTRVNELEIST
ncbi:restriction modification system DNA specificity domain [Acidithiobacillus ferrooxidans ATCC 53993]|nr:restriction modification system DNA specificity domain [Acidithiobacillus ferrooxidans ATCC 53993]